TGTRGWKERTMSRIATFTALIVFALFSAGCLVTSGSRVEESGVRISPQTLQPIEVGHTTAGCLLATLGEPTSGSPVADQPNVKLYRYRYAEKRTEAGAVFLIFGGRHQTSTATTTYFESTDGIVTRHWTEA